MACNINRTTVQNKLSCLSYLFCHYYDSTFFVVVVFFFIVFYAWFICLFLFYYFLFTESLVSVRRFNFDIVNFPFLDGYVPRSTSYGVYISQLIRFARLSSHADYLNTRNKVLTAKLLRQGYRYHKLRKV